MRRKAAALAASLSVLAGADSAFAADPGIWTNTGVSRIPLVYYQGVASDSARNFYFDGIYTGLFRTDRSLRQTAAAPEPGVIPPTVRAGEKYNHIGDIAWGPGEGGRILLYSRSGRPLGHSRLFRMSRGRLLRPHLWVRQRLAPGRYKIVARAQTSGGTRLRAYRRGVVIRRR